MRHVDLCSGIGGFALGFEWAGLSKPVLFCDIDPWCRKILAQHWPHVPIADDVKVLANDPIRNVPDCDILTAGYPCQPFSVAGKRKGTEDDRHIWPYIRRIVAQKRPAWCVFENVYGHISMGLDEVLSDLESESYAARAFVVPACGVNAPHRRNRLWIIARNMADPEGFGGNERHNEKREATGREQGIQGEVGTCGGTLADTDSERGCSGNPERQNAATTGQSPGDQRNHARRMETWDAEPELGRVAHGIPNRTHRLKGLGNAIVPQIAEQIALTIRKVSE